MSKKGFTLIELLVVIAIIAILAAILFPIFTGAKKSAARTTCLNNMRQIGMAIMGYVDDNNSRYPYDPQYAAPPGATSWDSDPNQATRCLWTFRAYCKNDKIWWCPVGAKRKLGAANYIHPAGRTKSDLWPAWGGGYLSGGRFVETNYSAYALCNPLNTDLCARGKSPLQFRDDCKRSGHKAWLVHDSYTYSETNILSQWSPHLGGLCGCFYDGHVEWIRDKRFKNIN